MTLLGIITAFKVADITKVVYIHSASDPASLCTVPFLGVTTIPNNRPIVLNATTSSTLPCKIQTFYLTD